jgi:arginine decarboxylase
VTNGTSTANKIVLQALTSPGDIVLVDRDCHKSHHYAMVLGGARPMYLNAYSIEAYSMYGAVPLEEIKTRLLELRAEGRLHEARIVVLTNCTFDGLVYNVERFMEEILAIKPDMIFLWDEAWFAFARCAPMYRQRTAMAAAGRLRERYDSAEYRAEYEAWKKGAGELDEDGWRTQRLLPDPDLVKLRVYATHSTHKSLSSLRQGSMIHVYDEEFNRLAKAPFMEAYLAHTSTSPNYQILASLDVARRQMELEGFELVQESIEHAMTLRQHVRAHPLLCRYFDILGPGNLIPERHRQSGVGTGYDPKTGWSTVEEAWKRDDFVLDPTRVTLDISRTGIDGYTFRDKYLMQQFDIQVNKTSLNTVLFITNIGTTRSAISYLLEVLIRIAGQIERDLGALNPAEMELHRAKLRTLTEELPPLPHFSHFHECFRPNPRTSEGDMRAAFFLSYDEANCEYIRIDDDTIDEIMASGRELVSTTFVIPYPPGFPILVPGQVLSREILVFLRMLDIKEIHGYRPELGLQLFREDVLARLGKSAKPPVSTTAPRPGTYTPATT